MRILTGIQSSGRPHLGNILGAIVPAIKLSQEPGNESFLFIADLHSLTTLKEGETRREYVRAIAATWLAFGYDTQHNTLWRQSRVPEHTELAWYLNCFTPMPMLQNATSYKDKADKLGTSVVNAGLFTYPVLQAADILLYDANLVPVGKDQRQHLEMTRDIASAVNRAYNNGDPTQDVFVLPEARIDERIMTIPGIDGAKMSKSYGNYIDIFQPANDLYKVIKKIKSDSTPLEEPKNPDTDITFQLYSLIASEEQTAQMRQNYEKGGYGYGHAKKELYELILSTYATERERFSFYMENPDELEKELRAGEEKARAVARQTIERVRQAMGFN